MGSAIEARRLYNNGHRTSFVGFEAVERITYVTHRDEGRACYFCKNKCMRTFIDVKLEGTDKMVKECRIPILPGIKRLIVGNG